MTPQKSALHEMVKSGHHELLVSSPRCSLFSVLKILKAYRRAMHMVYYPVRVGGNLPIRYFRTLDILPDVHSDYREYHGNINRYTYAKTESRPLSEIIISYNYYSECYEADENKHPYRAGNFWPNPAPVMNGTFTNEMTESDVLSDLSALYSEYANSYHLWDSGGIFYQSQAMDWSWWLFVPVFDSNGYVSLTTDVEFPHAMEAYEFTAHGYGECAAVVYNHLDPEYQEKVSGGINPPYAYIKQGCSFISGQPFYKVDYTASPITRTLISTLGKQVFTPPDTISDSLVYSTQLGYEPKYVSFEP